MESGEGQVVEFIDRKEWRLTATAETDWGKSGLYLDWVGCNYVMFKAIYKSLKYVLLLVTLEQHMMQSWGVVMNHEIKVFGTCGLILQIKTK